MGHSFNNHNVAAFSGASGFHLFACLQCGAWAEVLPRMLIGYCRGSPTAATARDLANIRAGRHPKYPREALQAISFEAMTEERLQAASLTSMR